MSYSEIYFNNYFLGDDTDLKNKTLVKYFDINYIPIENLPVAYFSMNNINQLKDIQETASKTVAKELIDKYLTKINKQMNNTRNTYNNYNIYPITVSLIIFYVFIIIFILRFIQSNYPLYYIYILVGIIILLMLFTSLWFLYVNNILI